MPRNDSAASPVIYAGTASENDDQDRRPQVRQQFPEQDVPQPGAGGPGRVDELPLAQRDHLAADEPGGAGPAEQRRRP